MSDLARAEQLQTRYGNYSRYELAWLGEITWMELRQLEQEINDLKHNPTLGSHKDVLLALQDKCTRKTQEYQDIMDRSDQLNIVKDMAIHTARTAIDRSFALFPPGSPERAALPENPLMRYTYPDNVDNKWFGRVMY